MGDNTGPYIKNLRDNIFSCMELSGQTYDSITVMPIQKLYEYLKWKSDLEEEKQKIIKERTKNK